MIKIPSYLIKAENKILVEELKNEQCEEKIYPLFIPVAMLQKWVKEVDESSTNLLEKPVYKLIGKDMVTATQNFLNATNRDFEKQPYSLVLPIPLLVKWVEDINRNKGRKK